MGRPVFWCPSVAGDVLRLEGREAHHAAVVHRLRVGDLVRVTDGAWSLADGVVTGVDRRWVEVGVESRGSVVRPEPRLTVVQAVPKKERAELAGTVQAPAPETVTPCTTPGPTPGTIPEPGAPKVGDPTGSNPAATPGERRPNA